MEMLGPDLLLTEFDLEHMTSYSWATVSSPKQDLPPRIARIKCDCVPEITVVISC